MGERTGELIEREGKRERSPSHNQSESKDDGEGRGNSAGHEADEVRAKGSEIGRCWRCRKEDEGED